MHRTPSRVTFLVPAVVCLAVAVAMAVQVARPLRDDFTWTPASDALSLDEARLDVEVWLGDRPLEEIVAAGELRLGDSATPVRGDALRVRLNQADRIGRVQLLLLATTATAGLTLLFVALAIPRRRAPRGAPIGDPEIAP